MNRHGMLRAVVTGATQRVLPEVPAFHIPTEHTDIEGAPGVLARLRERLAHQVRDPARWPLFAVEAVRYPDASGTTRTRLGIGLDYLVLDALSITTLYAELNALYADPDRQLPPIDVSFRDYLTQLPADPAAAERARAHWRGRLAELPPSPALPFARDPATLGAPSFTRRRLRLEPHGLAGAEGRRGPPRTDTLHRPARAVLRGTGRLERYRRRHRHADPVQPT